MRQPAVTKIQNSSSLLATQALQFYKSKKLRLFADAVKSSNHASSGLLNLDKILGFGVVLAKMSGALSSVGPSGLGHVV
jgi:hypothetical protein